MILLHPGEPQCNHEGPYKREEGRGGRDGAVECGARHGPKPRSVDIFQMVERPGPGFSSQASGRSTALLTIACEILKISGLLSSKKKFVMF